MPLQDSCQGDSGGSIWVVEGAETDAPRAVAIGLVSRGGDCAAKNQPGVAMRVKKLLDWIHHIVDNVK